MAGSSAPSSENAPEDILENFFCILAIAGQPEGETEHAPLVSGDQRLDGALVTNPEAGGSAIGVIAIDDRTLARDSYRG
jgi:hypothetical protein